MRWFTSDLHIGHQNIIDFCSRPFWEKGVHKFAFGDAEIQIPDVDTMNQTLLDNYNDVVADDDEVWFVGDLALGRQQTTVPFFKQFKGRKFLIPGNHDACHPMWGKYKKFVPLYEDAGFTIMPLQVMTHVAGQSVKVCHFPYWEDFVHNTRDGHLPKQDKFSGLRPDKGGGWLIHGHTHSPVRVTKDRQIHVGVDAWDFFPVPETAIEEIISGSA